jgi:hypothetical protein
MRALPKEKSNGSFLEISPLFKQFYRDIFVFSGLYIKKFGCQSLTHYLFEYIYSVNKLKPRLLFNSVFLALSSYTQLPHLIPLISLSYIDTESV